MSAALSYLPIHIHQADLWFTASEIATKTGIHERTLQRYAKEGKTRFREISTRGRNGRPIRQFQVASLPMELRNKLCPPSKPQIEVCPAAPSQESAPLFAAAPAPDRPGQRISLSPQAERQAAERLDAIQPLLHFDRAKYSALRLRDGQAVTTANLMASYIAETREVGRKKVSRTTLWAWVKAYRTGGLPALARKPRKDKGTSSFFTRYPAAAMLAMAERHKPHATFARAYDAIIRDQQLLQIPADELPSYETVRNFLESLPQPPAILARQGLRRYNETCAPHVARAYTDISANAFWVADHQIHDVELSNDCFPGLPLHAPVRLRFTCIMDMRSRKIVGYCWAIEGDWRSIVTALRRAAERYGPCQVFYCDNGADFKKVAKGAKRTRPTAESIQQGADYIARCGAIQQLGSEVKFCLPYNAQAKPIERLFGTVHKRLDAIIHGYLTGNSYNRPDAAILLGAQHRKLVKAGRGGESALMPASFFIQCAETWIEEDYNRDHHHRGKGMGGRSPNEVFDEGYPLANRRQADPDVLAQLLYERRTAVVRRTAVTVDGRRYMPPPSSPESWAGLFNENRRTVVVVFDPLDPQRAVALDDSGRKLADLIAETLVENPLISTPESREPVRQMSQTKGRLLKASSIAIATMHEQVALAGHKSAIEHLAERVAAKTPVDDLISQRIVRQALRPNDHAHAPASAFDLAKDVLGELLA